MKKLLLSSFLGLAALAVCAAPSQAWTFGLIPDHCCPFGWCCSCCGCNTCCSTITIKPYNAFTPCCCGNMCFNGCAPTLAPCCGLPCCGFPGCGAPVLRPFHVLPIRPRLLNGAFLWPHTPVGSSGPAGPMAAAGVRSAPGPDHHRPCAHARC